MHTADLELEQMRIIGDVPRVAKTLVDAAQNDPLYIYENNTPVRMFFLDMCNDNKRLR